MHYYALTLFRFQLAWILKHWIYFYVEPRYLSRVSNLSRNFFQFGLWKISEIYFYYLLVQEFRAEMDSSFNQMESYNILQLNPSRLYMHLFIHILYLFTHELIFFIYSFIHLYSWFIHSLIYFIHLFIVSLIFFIYSSIY